VGVSISWSLRDCIDISRYVVFYSSGGCADRILPSHHTHISSVITFYFHSYPFCHRTLALLAFRIPPTLEYTLPSNTRSARILVFHKQDWHGIFLRFDRDNSGTIDRKELHAALLGFGFSLPPEMVKRLEKRFAPPPQPGLEHQKKGISFDRFLLACVTVKHYTEAFRKWVILPFNLALPRTFSNSYL
jgi:hypothetical protein